jgi:nucleoid DNA-binding protein
MSTRKSLVRQFAETGLTQSEARTMADDILDVIQDRLENGEEVQITNFGRFELRRHKGRTMENPKTGEQHEVPDRYVVHFSPSDNFKERFRDDS